MVYVNYQADPEKIHTFFRKLIQGKYSSAQENLPLENKKASNVTNRQPASVLPGTEIISSAPHESMLAMAKELLPGIKKRRKRKTHRAKRAGKGRTSRKRGSKKAKKITAGKKRYKLEKKIKNHTFT